MKTRPAKHFLLASDFDQTLSFNDSGFELSELLGVTNFEQKVAGLSASHLVQQGGEVGGDDVDDVHLQRLLCSEVGRLANGALRPVPVAPVRLGKFSCVGGGIVDDLAA